MKLNEDVKIFSYVVDHDNGYAPNPYFRYCTLCGCKFEGGRNILQLAKERAPEDKRDWVIGTGGVSDRSVGHGKLIYAMRVDEKLKRGDYFADRRFEKKKPIKAGNYAQRHGDNEDPKKDVHRYKEFTLVSRHFYYFGEKAIEIPKTFKSFEKRGPGFKYIDPGEFRRFLKWLETETGYRPGMIGEPRGRAVEESRGNKRCKSSCSE